MNHSLAAIAERIQGRNDALRSELETLALLQSQLRNAYQRLQLEEAAHSTSRTELLTSLQSSHTIELQILQLKNNIRTIEHSISNLQTTTTTLQSKTQTLSNTYDTSHAPIYANHTLSNQLYVLQLQSNLDAATSKKHNRDNQLLHLAENSKRMRQDIDTMRDEHNRLVAIQNTMEEKEEEDDEEMVALGMQIKSVLAKVRFSSNSSSSVIESIFGSTYNYYCH